MFSYETIDDKLHLVINKNENPTDFFLILNLFSKRLQFWVFTQWFSTMLDLDKNQLFVDKNSLKSH